MKLLLARDPHVAAHSFGEIRDGDHLVRR